MITEQPKKKKKKINTVTRKLSTKRAKSWTVGEGGWEEIILKAPKTKAKAKMRLVGKTDIEGVFELEGGLPKKGRGRWPGTNRKPVASQKNLQGRGRLDDLGGGVTSKERESERRM